MVNKNDPGTRKSLSQEKPQTEQDVMASSGAQQEYAKRKQALELAFKEFHKVFMSKILDQNKSAASKKTEQHAVEKLVNSAVALDGLNAGEGIIALAVVAIREQLTVRDRVNELEYELCQALRDIKKLKSKLGIPDAEPKK